MEINFEQDLSPKQVQSLENLAWNFYKVGERLAVQVPKLPFSEGPAKSRIVHSIEGTISITPVKGPSSQTVAVNLINEAGDALGLHASMSSRHSNIMVQCNDVGIILNQKMMAQNYSFDALIQVLSGTLRILQKRVNTIEERDPSTDLSKFSFAGGDTPAKSCHND